jgi:hypothetical protein
MGFTRYWHQPRGIATEAWQRIVADTRTLLARVDIPLVVDDGNDISPLVNDERICFNGRGDERCEPFFLTPKASKFECVKTLGHPYDTVVAAVLAIAKHHAPSEVVKVSNDDIFSDLSWWDACWQPAIDLCAEAGLTFPAESLARLRADINHESPDEADAPAATSPSDGGAATPRPLSTSPPRPRPAKPSNAKPWLIGAGIVVAVVVVGIVVGRYGKHVPYVPGLSVVGAVLIGLSRLLEAGARPAQPRTTSARTWLKVVLFLVFFVALVTTLTIWLLPRHPRSKSPSAAAAASAP